jgi:TetR/AcrR family transcriptional regulator, upper aerobic nicotinate degradation pathway regulator
MHRPVCKERAGKVPEATPDVRFQTHVQRPPRAPALRRQAAPGTLLPARFASMALKRDADATRSRILRAARNQFMQHGYSGARIERISKAGKSSDRMIYYYFGSKEALYIEVLESVYTDLGAAESRLVLDATQPEDALRTLIAFTWNYYRAHPEFVALLANENLQRGRHITKSLRVKQLSRPVLEVLGRILKEGIRQGLFRPDLDVKKVYLSLAALGYFYLSNRYTLSSFLGDELMQPQQCDAWLEEITRVMLASVQPDAPRPRGRPVRM